MDYSALKAEIELSAYDDPRNLGSDQTIADMLNAPTATDTW